MKTKIGNPFKYCTLLLLILLCTSVSVQAQKYWSLQECIDQAIKNNITVKQREMNKESVKADLLQSKMAMLPNVNGQLTHVYNNGFAINPATNVAQADVTFRTNSMGLTANMLLFNGFQQYNTIRLRQSDVKASEQDLEGTKNTIRLNVANAYLQVLMNHELLERNKLQVQSTQQQVAKQEKLVELGAANRIKLLQLKAQASNEELQVVTSQNQLDQSYLTLWQLMNMEPDTTNKVVVPDFDIAQIKDENRTASQIYNDYVNQSPEVNAAKIRARSADLSRYVALGGRSIRLTANANINSFYSTQTQSNVGNPTSISYVPVGLVDGNFQSAGLYQPVPRYNFETTPFNDQFNRNLGKSAGLTLAIPLFNGWQVNTNVQKAKVNQVTADLNRKQAQNDLYKTITQAHQDFVSAQKKYEASERNFEANQESNSLAEGQFNVGAISASDYINTKNEFLKSQTSFVQSKYELVFRRKVLDFYSGKPLY